MGTPADVAGHPESHTARYLREAGVEAGASRAAG
jgi:hypothetical protein